MDYRVVPCMGVWKAELCAVYTGAIKGSGLQVMQVVGREAAERVVSLLKGREVMKEALFSAEAALQREALLAAQATDPRLAAVIDEVRAALEAP